VAHADPEFLLLGVPETLGTGRYHDDRYNGTKTSVIASNGQTGGVVLRASVHKTPSFDISDSFDGCEKLIASNSAFEATTASKSDADDYIQWDRISKLGILDVYSVPFIII
jgi:hypothetical protein